MKRSLVDLAENSLLAIAAIILFTVIIPFWLLQDLAAGRRMGEIK